ncbi:MAG: HAMP domain-containing histidine kinase [Gammaproteobacteria bacterium]|nr:HAMP domain-containing histidine kinase [Gammaproteobacteria bacterium]
MSPAGVSAPQLLDPVAMQVRYLYRNARTGLVVNAVLGLLMGWVLWARVERTLLLVWVVAIVGASALRLLQLIAFERRFVAAAAPRWANAFLVGSTFTAALWGAAPWWFGAHMTRETEVFLAFALGGLTAGAAAVLGVVQRVYVSYALVIMLPIIAWFFSRDTAYGAQMAAMLTVYLAAMLVTGLIYRRVVMTSIVVSHELAEARDRAETASRAKSEFLSRMSHELRTPLNAILGFAQLIALDRARTLSEEQHAQVRMINDSGTHLLDLINEVLDLARIEQGRLELRVATVGVAAELVKVVELLRPLAEQRGIRVEYTCAADVVALADAQRLRQILLNLIGNAIKYGDPGSLVDIVVGASGATVNIAVSDDGPGIPADRHEAVFEPFNRLDADTAATEGAGIGLTISRSLARGMHGDITLASAPGGPTTFVLDLPAASA